jgi:phage terminase large subunit-like protein
MQGEGFPMVQVPPTKKNLSEPMKELEALVKSGRLHHTGDPVLEWMASNVVAKVDDKENIMPEKERATDKIDGIVALLLALSRIVQADEEPPKSIYANPETAVM